MVMRTASPWWASLVFGLGLFFLLLGERLFGHLPTMRATMTTIGVIALVSVTGLRAFTTVRTTGGRRAVERTLLLCQRLPSHMTSEFGRLVATQRAKRHLDGTLFPAQRLKQRGQRMGRVELLVAHRAHNQQTCARIEAQQVVQPFQGVAVTPLQIIDQ